jgi:hypothetical protein
MKLARVMGLAAMDSVRAVRAARVCGHLRSLFTNSRRARMLTRRSPSRAVFVPDYLSQDFCLPT